jgi:hypothetical protein
MGEKVFDHSLPLHLEGLTTLGLQLRARSVWFPCGFSVSEGENIVPTIKTKPLDMCLLIILCVAALFTTGAGNIQGLLEVIGSLIDILKIIYHK